MLIETDWSKVFQSVDVDEIWDLIKERILEIANILCPFEWKKVRSDRPFWFNSSLCDIARHRDRLFRNYRRGGKKNKEIHKQAIAKRREFDKACKMAKKIFYKEQLFVNRKDHKKFWQVMGDLLGSKTDVNVDRVYKYGTDELLNENESVGEVNNFLPRLVKG